MATTTAVAGKPAILSVINPSGQRSRAVLNRSPFLLGRQSDNHLVLRDNRVSRVHCRISNEGGEYYIEDLNSRHGTYHNGQRMEDKVTLVHSDQVTFGFPDGYQIVFLREENEIESLNDEMTTTTNAVTAAATAQGPAQGSGAHSLAKLRTLVEVARAVQSSLSMREVLEAVVDAAISLTATERGFLLLKKGEDLTLEVSRDQQGNALSPDDLKVPARLIHRALKSRKELLSMHFDPHLAGAEQADLSIEALDLRSAVCIPLVRIKTGISSDTMAGAQNETVGIIYLDSKVELADMSAGNREILQTLALEASTVMENARLLEQERQKQRLEEELRIARGIQRSLLPRHLPSEGWFRAAGSSIASEQVGGDYYDVAEAGAEWWTIVVADVSGKGVSSALLAALLQGAFQIGPTEPAQIRSMFERLNRYVYERTEGEKYATIFYAAIRADGVMHWTNAGHCAPIRLSRNGAMEQLGPCALPVGILDVGEFSIRTGKLDAGDKLIIYSDGLSEAQSPDGRYFDHDHISRLLELTRELGANGVHSALAGAVEDFSGGLPQNDDMTLVVAEYSPPA